MKFFCLKCEPETNTGSSLYLWLSVSEVSKIPGEGEDWFKTGSTLSSAVSYSKEAFISHAQCGTGTWTFSTLTAGL